jgi:hypothetical protein
MEEPTAECAALVQQLQDVAGRLQQNGSDEVAWEEVARAAQALADALRESVKKGPGTSAHTLRVRPASNLGDGQQRTIPRSETPAFPPT